MRERALQVVLAIVGAMFCAVSYFAVTFVRQEPALAMMMTVYATLGVFLLLAVRRPAEHRSLIAFTAWSSLAHAALMTFQAHQHYILNRELMGVAVFVLIGVLLIALAPPKPTAHSKSAHA
ncbi:MAG TPA: DUF6632 domain-containing protein [Candidatus Koribacter sp.]|jgi:hypothetical protein